jgi:putative CocE/NonD family hydrolase
LERVAAKQSFDDIFRNLFRELHSRLPDKAAFHISTAFISRFGVSELLKDLHQSLEKQTGKDSISMNDAIGLCNKYCLYQLYRVVERLAVPLLAEEDNKRYIIQDSVLIKTKKGITIAAVVVRQKEIIVPQPAVLSFTIYADPNNLYQAKTGAAYGYASIVALTRGKGLSPDEIVPYEYEAEDVNAVIDWITRQPWSNGKVGMYGGSYNGFSQWAATRHLHPALKTIVPYVAAIPGLGLPMENNVFITANYGWAFYVTDNKYLDDAIYYDPRRWNAMQDKWYASGAAYRRIDSIDGTPNKWLQRWLQHPAYDKYWQNMVPYQQDYAKINIPVLTITGYYDDGQVSALHYLREHYKYNKQAEHYLIIGPYDHFGAQRGGTPMLRGYAVDPVALINTREITFAWLDYMLKGDKKPEMLKDRINHEVMGANVWRHAPSLEKVNNAFISLYLTDKKRNGHYQLDTKKPSTQGFLPQEVDLADRKTTNNDYYPYPIIRDSLDFSNGLAFISEPFDGPVAVDGMFSGVLKASINKKDMDIGVVLYEVMPDGRYFHLSYFLGRASYAKDMSTRNLLTPGKVETIPFERTRMVSRQLSKGSRLLVLLNINKNPFAQINYGTGKDVSDEDIRDAKEPLKIKWYTDSFIKIPVWR